MFAVAVGANGSVARSCQHRLSVDAFDVSCFDGGVAAPAGCGHIPVVDFGARVTRRDYGVAAVTIRARRRGLVSLFNTPAVYAQAVGLNRPSEWDIMSG